MFFKLFKIFPKKIEAKENKAVTLKLLSPSVIVDIAELGSSMAGRANDQAPPPSVGLGQIFLPFLGLRCLVCGKGNNDSTYLTGLL